MIGASIESRGSAAVRVCGLGEPYETVRAVHGLDFEIAVGNVHGFLGPKGAGETTTMRILLGLSKATRGASCTASFLATAGLLGAVTAVVLLLFGLAAAVAAGEVGVTSASWAIATFGQLLAVLVMLAVSALVARIPALGMLLRDTDRDH